MSQSATFKHRQPTHLRILSRPEWVETIVMTLRKRAIESGACDEHSANRIVVALTEAITNAIVHGNFGLSSALKEQPTEFKRALDDKLNDLESVSRLVDIRMDFEPGRCVWTVSDQGKGFDFRALLDRLDNDDDPDAFLSSGRGVAIMRAFVDEISWEDGGRRVRLAIDLGEREDHRMSPRRKYTAPVSIRVGNAGSAPRTGIARDLSCTGIAIVTESEIPVGANVELTLDVRREDSPVVTGKIVRCAGLAGEFHDVAVHFDEPLAELPQASAPR